MGKGRRLVLDRKHLIAMVGDEMFYQECPQFSWLAATALAATELYESSGKTSCCGGSWPIIRPIVDAVVEKLKNSDENKAEMTQAVRQYLEKKKKTKYGTIVVFYRASREQSHPTRFNL